MRIEDFLVGFNGLNLIGGQIKVRHIIYWPLLVVMVPKRLHQQRKSSPWDLENKKTFGGSKEISLENIN
jgi:hypothetical protein